jgi:hypothetical protein
VPFQIANAQSIGGMDPLCGVGSAMSVPFRTPFQ